MALRKIAVTLFGLATAAALGRAAPAEDDGYRGAIERWRSEREARLKADDGWLTVAGLFWLKEGANTVGSDPRADVPLPEGSAPARVGVFDLREGRTRFRVEPGVTVTAGGQPVTEMELRSDKGGSPDVLAHGRLRMFVIERNERLAIRLRDLESPMRREFTGLRWFPVRESYRVTARWVPYDPPRLLRVPNILGYVERLPSPGRAVFTLDGRELSLEPVLEDPQDARLFFIFKDGTSGKETYPAGRFLYAEMPKDESLVLDFNKAYTPPCAFTPYATCPLPPEGNRLKVRVEAGELDYGHH